MATELIRCETCRTVTVHDVYPSGDMVCVNDWGLCNHPGCETPMHGLEGEQQPHIAFDGQGRERYVCGGCLTHYDGEGYPL